MAVVRYAVIANDKTETSTSTTGTITIDLPEKGILAELYPQITYTKAYTANRPLPDFDAFTKFEVLGDGSTVIKSLSGQEVRALIYYNQGPFATSGLFWGTGGDTDSYSAFPLYFNRFAGDTKAGLDLSAYSNPQLKITYNCAATSIDGNTYTAGSTPAVKYNILAKIFNTAPPGFTNKFVQSREIDNFTQAASTEHATEIPRGFDLYRLMYRCGYLNVSWTDHFNKLVLDFDNGSWTPLDLDHEHVAMLQKAWFPDPVQAGWWDKAASADTVNLQVHQLAGMGFANAAGTGMYVYYDMHESGLHDILLYDNAGSAVTSGVNNHIFVQGWGPMQSICIPAAQLMDGGQDAIPTGGYGRIDLKITSGSGESSSAKGYIVAEYLKPNGK
jgi:hypothetical protein